MADTILQVKDLRKNYGDLKAVDGISFEILETAMDPGRKVFPVVGLGSLLGQPAASLGGDIKLVGALFLEAREEAFTAAVAIDVGSVEEIHAAIERGVQRSERFLVIDITPGTADRPGAETDLRNFPTGASKSAVFHGDESKRN